MPPIEPSCLQSGFVSLEALEPRSRVLVASGWWAPKVLWVLDHLEGSRPSNRPSSDGAICPSELVSLAWSLLGLAHRASLARARAFLRARSHRLGKFFRRRCQSTP